MKFLSRSISIIVGLVLIAGVSYLLGYLSRSSPGYSSVSRSTIVQELQDVWQLVSTRMTLSQVLESQKDLPDEFFWLSALWDINKVLFSDKLTIYLVWHISAWVDLSKLSSSDITKRWSSVTISLPEVEIFDVYLDESKSTLTRELGILTRWNPALETELRQEAIQLLRDQALSWDIITQAYDSAQLNIANLVRSIDAGLEVGFE